MRGFNQNRPTHPMFEAGDRSQVDWGNGNWIFLDIGFAKHTRSCGLLFGDGNPTSVAYATAKSQIVERIRHSRSMVNLVIEAPLSVSFDSHGNPTGRSIEKKGKQTRYWYVGPGCVVMVAAIYLIRDIVDAGPDVSVRLFEGFVSYKERSGQSRHVEDVSLLREVVRDPVKYSGSIFVSDQLRIDPRDSLLSAFHVVGVDCGIPAVIERSL
jgi:hypothetical protein